MSLIGQQIAHCQEPTKETDMPELPESARMTDEAIESTVLWASLSWCNPKRAIAAAAGLHAYTARGREQVLVDLLAAMDNWNHERLVKAYIEYRKQHPRGK